MLSGIKRRKDVVRYNEMYVTCNNLSLCRLSSIVLYIFFSNIFFAARSVVKLVS